MLISFKKNSQNSVIDEEPSEERIHIALSRDEDNTGENVDDDGGNDN